MPTARHDLIATMPEHRFRFLGHDTHAHVVPQLIHVVVGSADIAIDGRSARLRARENLWLAAGVPHSAAVPGDGVVFGALLSADTLPAGRAQLLGAVPRLTRLMDTILGAAPATDDQIRPFRAALDATLQSLSRDVLPLRPPAHPVARRIARVAAGCDRTLAQLAVEHGIGVRQVQRVFLAETGLPFTRWRARARLNVAIRHLRGGSSLVVAAHAAGYAGRSGLLKALCRETGVPERLLAADPLGALEAARGAERE